MSQPSILVTGASGHLGRRVVDLLLAKGAENIIATTRKPEALGDLAAKGVDVRRADFEDEASLESALAGVERALLVSTDALDKPGRRTSQHLAAVRAMVKAGVKYVLYTSLPNAANTTVTIAVDHAKTEEAIVASGLDYTILRNNLYADYFPYSLAPAVASGKLVDAKGEGAVAWITREDCAQAAAGALLAAKAGDRIAVDVTGPEPVTSAQLAKLLGELVGREIVHVSVTPEAMLEQFLASGMPRGIAEAMASFDGAIAKGDLSNVTDAVSRYAGRPPTSVNTFLAQHAATLKAAAK
ncbi:NADPH:quinone oxidoreductase 2 [Labilithrix luteola]|uniref:NADPH:quinone oxidoreductase 2 n=1 Tax=Labilithrix luteola TaxID=1391654 RepID=A0A0K1PTE2_9BACT|nr:SDR family oxidoreductase [Labilithrix luteola]AKU96651.1 NADPH:quinone oxidoreductase 2 [Labilithrix luteola]